MKNLFLILSVFFTINSFAQEDKTVTLTVSGSGKTLEEAKNNALRSAIEQAFGAFISSKTEILNDKVIADEITSVSSGNIQSYDMLNESQLPNGNWGITLKAIVSVSKLTSFVQSKGIAIEIKGSLFAINIKQQLLNEQAEVKVIYEMIGLLHEQMQTSFDYNIKSGEPVSTDSESKNWEIPLEVTAIANKNMDFCSNYCFKTLSAVCLELAEVEIYNSLNKKTYPFNFLFNGINYEFHLRKRTSVNALMTLINQWNFYVSSFKVLSGMDEIYNTEIFNSHIFGKIKDYSSYGINDITLKSLDFPVSGQHVGTFKWMDKRTLAQIEQMNSYSVKATGITSQFKQGGFLIYTENNTPLIIAICDIGEAKNFNEANEICKTLSIGGYNNWRLPDLKELKIISDNFHKNHIGGLFLRSCYWSITQDSGTYSHGDYKKGINMNNQGICEINATEETYFRPVKSYLNSN